MADDGFTVEQRKILERWANLEITDNEASISLSPNGRVHLRHAAKYDAYTLKRLENEEKCGSEEWTIANIRNYLLKRLNNDVNAVDLALQKLDGWAELKVSNEELSSYIGYAIQNTFRDNTIFSKYLLTHLRNKLKGVDCNTEKEDIKGWLCHRKWLMGSNCQIV